MQPLVIVIAVFAAGCGTQSPTQRWYKAGAGQNDYDVPVENGGIIYVDRAPTIYIYGEVQRPGQVRLERGMTLLQGLAAGRGLTPRGTARGIQVHRKDASGAVTVLELKPNDPLESGDVVYVRESIF